MELKNKLKELRVRRKLSGTKIADVLDVSSVYYYDLEKGAKRLNEDILNKLADFYDVTIDYILGRAEKDQTIIESTLADNIEQLSEESRTDVEEYIELLKLRETKIRNKDALGCKRAE